MSASAADPHTDLLKSLDAVIWEADPVTFQFTYVSRGAEGLLGYTLEQWLTQPAFWVDLLHPDDRDAAVRECQTAVRDCRDHTFEYRVRAADGRVLWIRDIVRVCCDGKGQALGLHGVMLDITGRKQTESALHRKDRYYRALIEQALDLIVVAGRDGTIRYESPSTERILGCSPIERLGRHVFELVHPDDVARLRAVFEDSMATGQPTTLVQFRCRHADGSWRTLEAIGRRFVDEDGEPVGIVNCRDVTERQQLETQARDAQKMEALGRLTSTVAHDFNNVLLVVLGSVEFAIASEYSAGLRPELAEIKRSAELGAALTRQLLAFSRPTADAPEIVEVDTTLGELTGILQRLVGPVVRIELKLDAAGARVRLGHGMLEQIAMNLTVNARDAMPRGGTLQISTTRGPRASDVVSASSATRVTIEVADNGSGMDAEIRARMFEPYFTTKTPGKGTGLGLSTVYRIVRDSGGSIDVDSEPGRGTRVRIHLLLAG
jgi:two-component system, cell cycle sensor histidine kinase and response regulator CckA